MAYACSYHQKLTSQHKFEFARQNGEEGSHSVGLMQVPWACHGYLLWGRGQGVDKVCEKPDADYCLEILALILVRIHSH